MSERLTVPTWAQSDAAHPEREAEWCGLLAELDALRANRATGRTTMAGIDAVLREYPDASIGGLWVPATEAVALDDRRDQLAKSRRRWIDAVSEGLGTLGDDEKAWSTPEELTAHLAGLRKERDEAMALAWPGEHRFPDQSYKAMHGPLVAQLRAAEKERDDERTKANEWLSQAHDARAQLAALHAAASRWNAAECDVVAGVYASVGSGEGHAVTMAAEASAACDALVDVCDALAAAAKAHDEETAARAVAGVTEERDARNAVLEKAALLLSAIAKDLGAATDEPLLPAARRVREQRDTLAAALAEVRSLIRDDHEEACSRRHGEQYRCRCDYDDRKRALSALPADLAAQRDARVRAEALREAADEAEHSFTGGAEIVRRIRSMAADEAERGGR